MISIKQLKNELQKILNDKSSNLGLSFKLFTDTGKYKKANRSVNDIEKYVNGVYTITATNISNASTGIEFGTMTARCELLVKCNEEVEKIQKEYGNDGNAVKQIVEKSNEAFLDDFRAYLDDIFASHTYFRLEDKNNREYEISANYTLAISGQRDQKPGIGDCLTYVFFVYYNIVRYGENSRDYKIFLDGNEIPYGIFTLRRVPTQTANVLSGQRSAVGKSVNDNTILGISVDCPAFASSTNEVIKNYILNGEENIAHILTLELKDKKQDYLVLFGEVDATAQGVLNVGQQITFVEAVDEYGIISFPSCFNLYENKGAEEVELGDVDRVPTVYNITKKEFTNIVSVGDMVASYETLNGLMEI